MKYSKKKDIIIILCIVMLAFAIFIFNQKGQKNGSSAEIYFDNNLVKVVDLTKAKDYTFRIEENEDILFHVFEDGSISFEESDCKDKICVNSGKHSKAGDTAACLPNKVVLKIVSAEDEEVDIIISK